MNKKKKITLAVAILLVFCLAIGGTLAWLIDTTPTVKNTFTMGKVKIKLDEAKTDDEGNGMPVDPAQRTETGNAYHLVPGEKTYTKDPTVTVLKGSENCYVRMFVKVTLNYTTDELKAALLRIPAPTLAEDLQYLVDNDWLNYDEDTAQYSVNPAKLMGCIVEWPGDDVWTREGPWFTELEGTPEVPPHNENKKEAVIEYDYVKDGGIVDAGTAEQVLPALFKGFKFPTDFPTQILDHLAEALSTEENTVTAADLMPVLDIVAQAIQAEGFANMAAAFTAAGQPKGYVHEPDNPVIHLPPFTIPGFPNP